MAPGTAGDPHATLHEHARSIFAQAFAQADIQQAFDRRLRFDGPVLALGPHDGRAGLSIDLSRLQHVLVIALGKAAVPMVEALCARLPQGLRIGGVCCAPELPQHKPEARLCYFAGGHPFPNAASFRAARAALRLLRCATERTFIFFLVSGGGSSLFELPASPDISLADTIAFHRALVGSGATITEINVVRKRFSAVKGGRLAAAAGDAHTLTLQIADVPAPHLDALASGPTIPDRSTVEQCQEILVSYELLARFPPAVRHFFERVHRSSINSQTLAPAEASDSAFPTQRSRSETPPVITLLSNDDLLRAAAEEARRLGYAVVVDNTCDDWDAHAAANYLLDRLFALQQRFPRLCLLSGGEVTVRLGSHPGMGGRNQQFALHCALLLHDRNSGTGSPPAAPAARATVLSAGSDGIDGSSPAAGAIADETTVSRARVLGFDPQRALDRFDAYPLFAALSDTVLTGATGNNLRDLRVLIASTLDEVS